ncbi:MAG: response regulator transcription factor [candidate division NC10 bacterium]|jgi:DNA-binding NarL/FixJ family response regulator
MAVEKPREGQKQRILIVDDHPIVREGLTTIINEQTDLVVCGEAEDAQTALEAVGTLRPDLMIVDISLKGINGIELVKLIQRRYEKMPILVLSMHDESLYVERVLRAGARGYIMKQEGTEKVVTAIHKILGGDIYVSEAMRKKLLRTFQESQPETSGPSVERLSDRELEVFRLIGQGYGTRQIADTLHVSVKTVNTYRQHIKEKLKFETGSELLRHAIQWVQSEGS